MDRWEVLSKRLKDAGHKINRHSEPLTRKEISYPTMYLDTNEVPSLANLKLGEKGRLVAEFVVTGTNQRDDKPKSFDIEIRKMAVSKGG